MKTMLVTDHFPEATQPNVKKWILQKKRCISGVPKHVLHPFFVNEKNLSERYNILLIKLIYDTSVRLIALEWYPFEIKMS